MKDPLHVFLTINEIISWENILKEQLNMYRYTALMKGWVSDHALLSLRITRYG